MRRPNFHIQDFVQLIDDPDQLTGGFSGMGSWGVSSRSCLG